MVLDVSIGLMIGIILYIGLALVTIILAIFTSYREKSFNSKLLDALAILIAIVYLIDVILPFATGNMSSNLMGFTLGTVLAPFIIITRFIKPFDKMKPTVALISAVAIFTYSLYFVRPESFINLTAQRILEIYVYYSLIFIYGVLSITTKEIDLNIKKCYKELIALSLIELFSFTVSGIITPAPSRASNDIWAFIESYPAVVIISFTGIMIIYLINKLIEKIKVKFN